MDVRQRRGTAGLLRARRTVAVASTLILLLLLLSSAHRAAAHLRDPAELESAHARVEARPEDAEARLARARLRLLRGDAARALEDLEQARRLGVDAARFDLELGLALLELGRAVEAEARLHAFLERDPRHVGARRARARALEGIGRPHEAAREIERAIELSPAPTPDLYLSRARLLVESDGGDPARALRSLEEAHARLGTLVALESYALELERRDGRFDAALARVDRLAAGSAQNRSWLLRRAAILEEAGRPEEAADSLRGALREIERLPDHRRTTDATLRLERQARLSLQRLEGALASGSAP